MNTPRPHLRMAHPEDAAAISDLSFRSKQSNGYDDAFMAACRDELTVNAHHINTAEYWVAEDETIKGCACLAAGDQDATGEVHSFFIDPHYQGQGIGRALWEKVRERARLLGLRTLVLDADPHAVPFYEAMGFDVVGTSPSGSIPGRFIPKMCWQDRVDP